ncbi:endolysin [Microbacterium phage WilliamStrong]|nr:endolysin [Microbacterium phage WilliamStrong]
MTTFVERDGQRLTPYMLYQINRLAAAFYAVFGVYLLVTSGIRTAEEQERIFRERYTLTPNGRKVYDTRWWNGRLWYRISSAGTVAVPRTSNHEIQGTKAAVDLRDSGRDAGVSVAGSRRSNWLRANAPAYGLVASGFGFGEAWHYDVLNIFAAVPSGGGSTKPKENTVIHYHREDYTCRNGGRKLTKGQNFWLNTTKGAAASQATNIVGGIGDYNFAIHIYATGTPGDSIDVTLYWGRGNAESSHYNEHLVFGPDGRIEKSFPFIRPVAKGYSVFVRAAAGAKNVGTTTVTLLDSDSLLVV